MEKIIITGGSGFIGTNAVDYAIKKGWDILNIDYNIPKEQNHKKYWKNINIIDRKKTIEIIKDFSPNYILHLAGKTGMDIKKLEELDANIDGVKNIIEGAKECPNLKRVVFTSSLLVCKNGYIPKYDEDYCPPNFYGESKMLGEKIVRSSNMKFQWSIIRPTSIWGPWFEQSYKSFFRTINRKIYFHPGKEIIVKPKSYVGNTVHMMFSILMYHGVAVNKNTYYLSDYPETSTNEWAEIISRQLGKGTIKTIPITLLRCTSLIGDAAKLLKIEFPITTFRLNNMLTGASYPIDNTREIVGTLPYSLSDGVKETIRWMKEKKYI